MALQPRTWPDREHLDEPAGRRPGTVAAAGVAVLLLLAPAAVALGGGGDPAPSRGAPDRPAVSAPAGSSSPGRLVDNVAVEPGVEPLLTAPDVTWQLLSGVALPYSDTAGPRVVDGPVYGGFERSQTGALLAAVQISTRYALTPGEGWREVVERQVLPGVGREVYTRLRTGVVLDDPPGTYGQFAGFRVVAHTPDVTVVQLVSRFSSTGSLQVSTATVKWARGDWRLELQPDGGVSPSLQLIEDLDGFVVWGGA